VELTILIGSCLFVSVVVFSSVLFVPGSHYQLQYAVFPLHHLGGPSVGAACERNARAGGLRGCDLSVEDGGQQRLSVLLALPERSKRVSESRSNCTTTQSKS
jgi:hypothetical protein